MFGEKNQGKCTMYIGIAVMAMPRLCCPLFIFTSFNTTPLILLVKINLIRNYKSVKGA